MLVQMVSPLLVSEVSSEMIIGCYVVTTQFFLAPSSRFFSPWRIARFVTSVWPFVCEWATKENLCHILIFFVKYLKGLQSNCIPLFDMSVLDIPNRHITLCQTKSITFRAVIVGTTSTSCHLEKYFTATIMNLFCLTVFENGPKMSIPIVRMARG